MHRQCLPEKALIQVVSQSGGVPLFTGCPLVVEELTRTVLESYLIVVLDPKR